jgi:hypothetical protein
MSLAFLGARMALAAEGVSADETLGAWLLKRQACRNLVSWPDRDDGPTAAPGDRPRVRRDPWALPAHVVVAQVAWLWGLRSPLMGPGRRARLDRRERLARRGANESSYHSIFIGARSNDELVVLDDLGIEWDWTSRLRKQSRFPGLSCGQCAWPGSTPRGCRASYRRPTPVRPCGRGGPSHRGAAAYVGQRQWRGLHRPTALRSRVGGRCRHPHADDRASCERPSPARCWTAAQ